MSRSSDAKKFVSSEDGEEFKELVKKHYKGFVHVPATELKPPTFYNDAKKAFDRLRDANYYHVRSIKSSQVLKSQKLKLSFSKV